MNYTVEKLEASKVKFNIDVDNNEWESAIDEAYKKTKNKYSLVGFRKGHVPKKVLEGTYGKQIFFEDAIDIVLPKVYDEILEKETELEVVGRPVPEVVDLTEEGLKLAITVTVRPEVTLGKYTGLKIDSEKVEVADAEVDAEVELALDRAARIVEAEEGYKAANGDTLNLYFSGSVDGEKFEGGTADEYDLELGSGMFIPGFEEQLIGVKKGEERDVKVTFPEQYEPSLAGKDAVFATKIHKITKKEIPAFDEEFVKDVSEFDTVAEYKKDIKAKLLKEAEDKRDRENENKLVEEIVASSKVEVPEEMTELEAEDMVKEFEYRLMYQGLKMDDYLEYTGMTKDKIKADYKEAAERNVRTRLVLEEIIKKEGMTPSEETINQKIAQFAGNAGKSVEEYKKKLTGREIDYIANQVLSEELMAYLKEKNTFVEKAAAKAKAEPKAKAETKEKAPAKAKAEPKAKAEKAKK